MKPLWVIQQNLISEEVYERGSEICKKYSIPVERYKIIAFDDNPIHDFNYSGSIIVYGSAKLIKMALEQSQFKEGLFFNKKNLNVRTWNKKLGGLILNIDAKICTIKELSDICLPEEFFIRPNGDLKIFAGTTLKRHEFNQFFKGVKKRNYNYDENLEIIFAPLKRIDTEWRFFVVDGEIVGASQYAKFSKLNKSIVVPVEAYHFVKEVHNIWYPDQAYVIDVGKFEDKFKVIEYNCINCAGMYQCDLENIILKLSKYVESR